MIQAGDHFIYTTPNGRERLFRVTRTDVKPKNQHKPGLCVELLDQSGDAQEPGLVFTMWPEDVIAFPEWRRAGLRGVA